MTSPIPEIPALAPDLDENVLLRLFDLAGPAQSIEILDRLILDLRGVQQVLARAANAELSLLQRQNHSLIGIAGTVGATALHQMALDCGRQLRDGGASARDSLVALVEPVERLIARLTRMRADR